MPPDLQAQSGERGGRRELARDLGLALFLDRRLSGTELLNRDEISIITLLLTYRCPAACDHCVFESSPTNTATLDPGIAEKLIAAAARQSPPPVLGFSGGEPFLQLAMMRRLASYAAARGMCSEVVSSSAWAKNGDYARRILADLKRRGLATYCTSVDRFHTPFVAPEKMRTAVLTAREVGLHVILNYQVDPASHAEGEDGVVRYLGETLDLPEETVRSFQVNPLVTTPVGRARRNVDGFLYEDKDFREGCPMVTEVVTLSPFGFLYPCCGMVVGEPPEQAGLFIHDRLEDRSVEDIARLLETLKRDFFFKLLQYLGPYRILQELKRRDPTLAIRDHYVGACDACLELTDNPRVVEAARDYLAECAARMSGGKSVAA